MVEGIRGREEVERSTRGPFSYYNIYLYMLPLPPTPTTFPSAPLSLEGRKRNGPGRVNIINENDKQGRAKNNDTNL